MAGPGGEGDLRRLLKLHRTEIAMAVDDVFPLLHGLADHDVVPEHVFKETLGRAEREGSHRAFHALLTWLLGRDAAAVRDFWAVLFKDYNLERYSRLRPLRGTFPGGRSGLGRGPGTPGVMPRAACPSPVSLSPAEVELGRQRRSPRLSPSSTAPAPHRPQGKRKAPEEREGARAAQPSPRHTARPGLLAKARTVRKPEGAETPGAPHAGGELWQGLVPVAEGCPLCQAPRRSPQTLASHLQGGEPQLHPQGQPLVPTLHSQDPVHHQENEDECAACGDGGELICCDGCPRAFHLACLVPPLPRVPSGTWRCGSCVTDTAGEQTPGVLGEEACSTHQDGGDGSICGRCFTRIPAPQHGPVPGGDP
ncbi:AIRE regulator, partial [Aegotheles bennettii]|nr:AIRE regulator [Aegotheles bennettii]